MKRRQTGGGRLPRWARLTVGALSIVLLLTSAGGAVAASKERVGDRISLLFEPPTTFPAETAFHIWHGFIFEDFDHGYGRYAFRLEVDGVERAPDFFEVDAFDRGTISKVWVFNFPDGLTGTHTFDAHWITPYSEESITVTVAYTP